jgi:SAM-dependent methyltransferase
MPATDADRWNERYRENRNPTFEQPRPFLVENAGLLPRQGLAVDLAMGLGGNAGFLLERGLRVVGVDISVVAALLVKRRRPQVMVVVADLTRFYLPPNRFDLVLIFYYLQRDLWPVIQAALRPGGILVYETLTRDMQAVHPAIDQRYLLQPGELETAFPDLETWVYHEGWTGEVSDHPKAVASLVAHKSNEFLA